MFHVPRRSLCILIIAMGLAACGSETTQVVDRGFRVANADPAFAYGRGPIVMVDEGHHNFHTAEGRYRPFAELLRSDGYLVRPLHAEFTPDSLARGKILLIANALSEENVTNWSLPNHPAFTSAEINAVVDWVAEGGALLLIADHMPMPAAAAELAAAFGVRFENGYAIRKGFESPRPPIIFDRASGGLKDHEITRGRFKTERIESVATFTGQAFQAEGDFTPLLVFGPSTELLYPEVPAVFNASTQRIDIEGWYQGIAMHYGDGRVAMFGEAAMFSAQFVGEERQPMGMNSPVAPQNAQFALNTLHWLSRLLD
ncbi:DUF4350 domain-containing protein [Congregibacter variabilis]|uniref:DUF4350 domain-containing protein n=1 Tax=Congregibacter variabilis TaxID=3081200 RepID=A0ABZ0HZF8_9GAMM|nr:DUF4350 domain-containing protein [Congregibacter sp. IMCC43200]